MPTPGTPALTRLAAALLLVAPPPAAAADRLGSVELPNYVFPDTSAPSTSARRAVRACSSATACSKPARRSWA